MKSLLSLLVLGVALLGVNAQEPKKEPDLFTKIKNAKLADKPFTLVITVTIKEGTKEKFEAQAKKTSAATLKEKGCTAYDFHNDTTDPNRYILVEKWDNLAALEAHMKEQHTIDILKVFGEVSAGPMKAELYAQVK